MSLSVERIKSSALIVAALAAFALNATPPAHPQEIHIWEDEHGIKHFSDRRPEGDFDVTSKRAIAEPGRPVTMENVGSEREPQWRLSSRLHGPVTVRIALSEATNVVSEPLLPALIELPANSSRDVLIGPFDERQSWRYRIEMDAIPGSLEAEPDYEFPYKLPIDPETSLRIGQGFNGQFSHNEPHSRHAVDFSLPVGTPVLAARGGRVMKVERWFHQSGQNLERDGPRANHVRVVHEDGTMAVYAHLDYNSIQVRPGQQVETGQLLGRSGNTGFSTGPHLHFAVQVNLNMQLVSIPFPMIDHEGREISTRFRR